MSDLFVPSRIGDLSDVALTGAADGDPVVADATSGGVKRGAPVDVPSLSSIEEGFFGLPPFAVPFTAATEVVVPLPLCPFPLVATGLRISTPTAQAGAGGTNFWLVRLIRQRMSVPVTSHALAALADLPDSYWRFNDAGGSLTAADAGSGGRVLTYSTPTSPTLQQPPLDRQSTNHSAHFVRASSTDAMAAASAWDFSGQHFTIEAFINMDSFGTPTVRQTIFGRPTTAGQPNIEVGGQNATPIKNGKLCALQPGNFLYETQPYTILPGRTYHVAYRKNGSGPGTQDWFVNGVKQLYGTIEIATTDFSSGSAETHVGSREHATGQYFDGFIDEVAVYMSALSDARIQAHADAGAFSAEIARKTTDAVGLDSAFGTYLGNLGEPITAWQPWTFDGCPFDPYASACDKDDQLALAFYPIGNPASLANVTATLTYEAG